MRVVFANGGTSYLVMGLVFKTSRAAARVGVGGFDSHVPPPSFDKPRESVDSVAVRFE